MCHVWRQMLRDPGWLLCVFSRFVVPVPVALSPGESSAARSRLREPWLPGVPCALSLWIMSGGGDAEVQISAPERRYCVFWKGRRWHDPLQINMISRSKNLGTLSPSYSGGTWPVALWLFSAPPRRGTVSAGRGAVRAAVPSVPLALPGPSCATGAVLTSQCKLCLFMVTSGDRGAQTVLSDSLAVNLQGGVKVTRYDDIPISDPEKKYT